MTTRVKLLLLILTAAAAIYVASLYFSWGRTPQLLGFQTSDTKFTPLDVDSPALKLYLLDRLQKSIYTGRHENIFAYRAPRELAKTPDATHNANPPSDTTQGPPPLVPPYRFFGYVMNLPSGNRRGFFQNGEDVFIAAEGEVLQNRFRILRISNNAAEVEEIASGRRASVPIEEAPPIA